MSTSTNTPILETVEVQVPSAHVPFVNGGYGKVAAKALLLPRPEQVGLGRGVTGLETELAYSDSAVVEAIAAADEPGVFFKLPDQDIVVRIVRRRRLERGAAFFVVAAGDELGEQVWRREQAQANIE